MSKPTMRAVFAVLPVLLLSTAGLAASRWTVPGTSWWPGSSRARQEGWRVAAGSTDDMVITGVFKGTVDFGGGPLASAGGKDIFLAEITP